MAMARLDELTPSDSPLLALTRRHVDDGMLSEIAQADYGMDAKAHLDALRRIDEAEFLGKMEWEPKEVLELIRWSEPEDPNWKPGSTGVRGHWMRLFACAHLIRAAAEPANDGYFTGEDSTIIQLVDSALKLGEDVAGDAMRFLAWRRVYRQLDDWDRPYFAAGLLILAVARGRCSPGVATTLIAEVGSRELRPSEMLRASQKSETWLRLTKQYLLDAADALSEPPRESVQKLASTLLGS